MSIMPQYYWIFPLSGDERIPLRALSQFVIVVSLFVIVLSENRCILTPKFRISYPN